MFQNNIGEFAALLTAFFWTITALSFTSASHKIGSLSVNFWRLVIGIILISLFVSFQGESFFPLDIDFNAWFWLLLSGVIGIFLGDLFLFKSFTITGPRVSLLIMSISPPIAAVISWFALGDSLSFFAIVGMIVTISGIVLVILTKNADKEKGMKLKYDKIGVVYAILGAFGQATGLVMSKIGLQYIDNPFVATQIRLYAGIIGFIILISWVKRWTPIMQSLNNKKAMGTLSIGSFFGPFLGISFSLIAVKYTNPGIVQTITSITPILIIPFAVYINKEKIGILDIVGALVAVCGVSLFFIF